MTVLVINSGSSSLKYQVVDPDAAVAYATGLVERIGSDGGRITHTTAEGSWAHDITVTDHRAAMTAMQEAFAAHGPSLTAAGIAVVGHRVAQGADSFGGSVLIDDPVLAAVDELADLAPLHNPANTSGIRGAREIFPAVPHVAVFDTAFHATMPPVARTYALDREVAERYRIRRYGFHGTSHAYVSREAARILGRTPDETNVIVLHLGNGASACAVRAGESVDTSMGLTPLEGLVMGTRTGDIDAAAVFHLARVAGYDIDLIDEIFNTRSGVLGLCGRQDMRDLVDAALGGDTSAELALDVYCYRIRKYIGAYTAILGRVDAVVFTAGVGENSAPVRARCIAGLDGLGIALDAAANASDSREARDIATVESRVRVLVIPTNEELEIARQAMSLVRGTSPTTT